MLPHIYTDCDQNHNKIQIRNTNDDNIMKSYATRSNIHAYSRHMDGFMFD